MSNQDYNEKDPYSILNVPFDATDEEIRNAYRSRALQWHPDKHPGESTIWSQKFQLLQQAYSCLKDSTQRHIYDATGSWGNNQEDDDSGIGFNFEEMMNGNPQVIFMTSSFPVSGNIFEMLGSFQESGGFGNLLSGGVESLISGISSATGGDKNNLANIFTQMLDPLKERAKDTIHRLETENRKLEMEYEKWQSNKSSQPHLYQLNVSIEDLWNEDKPRKKKYKIGNEDKTIVKLYLGVQKVDETRYVQIDPRDDSTWIWKWTSTPEKADGFISPKSGSWTYLGQKADDQKWVNVWVNEYNTMWVIWCDKIERRHESSNIIEELPDFLKFEEIKEGGWVYWGRPRHSQDKEEPEKYCLVWHPSPELRERGDGWFIPDSGVWVNTDLKGENEDISRSPVRIQLPLLPKVPKWNEYVRSLGDLDENFEMDSTFGFFN